MLVTFLILFIASVGLMAGLLVRRMPQARIAIAIKNAQTSKVPAHTTVSAAAAQAGNVFILQLEKSLRRFKVTAMRFDNLSTRWLHRLRDWSNRLSRRYYDGRIQKYGFPNISFDSSFVADIENWFEGFFPRYFRRGVGFERTTIREDLVPREKVLIAVILANPKNVEAYRRLGLYYFEKGNYSDALSAFQAIRKIDPTNSEAAERVRHIREAMGISEANA